MGTEGTVSVTMCDKPRNKPNGFSWSLSGHSVGVADAAYAADLRFKANPMATATASVSTPPTIPDTLVPGSTAGQAGESFAAGVPPAAASAFLKP